MKKKNNNTQRRLPAAAALLMTVALLLTTSCSRDAAGDTPAGGDFAPGTVPITFAAAAVATPHAAKNAPPAKSAKSTKSPTSRTPPPGTAAGQWTKDDWVTVEVDGVAKKYRIADDGTTTRLVPADAANTHYWASPAQTVSVRAWYNGNGNYRDALPESGKNSWGVDTDQRDPPDDKRPGYQRSDFLYAPARTVSYADARQGAVQGLTFYHQTSRVVVRLRKGGAVTDETVGKFLVELGETGEGNMFDSGIMDETALPIDPSRGRYSAMTALESGWKSRIFPREILPTPAGYARCFEALVIPQDMSGKAFVRLWLPDFVDIKEYIYRPDPGEGLLRGGYTHTYDVTVSPYGQLHVTTAGPIAGWEDGGGGGGMAYEEVIPLDGSARINDNRTYLLTGTKDDVQNLITITGGTPTIIMRNLDIKGNYPISIQEGTATIKVEGENRITATFGPAIYSNSETGNIRIIGDGRDKSRLTAVSEDVTVSGYPAIGGVKGECGSISLSDITLIAQGHGHTDKLASAAAIGTSGDATFGRLSGPITITNCHVEATAGGPGAAAIGFGYARRTEANTLHEMGDITITNSTLKCTVQPGPDGEWPAHIGGSTKGLGQYTVGKISITPPEGMNTAEFFKDFNGKGEDDSRVIAGFPNGAKPTNGAEFDVWWRGREHGKFIFWRDADKLP